MSRQLPRFRRYGSPPYQIVVVHGGPGAPGEVAPVARELADEWGVLEPLQSQTSIAALVLELKTLLEQQASLPVVLIGHSWGAWLSIILAAHHPQLVKKLILVSSGSLDEAYRYEMDATRLQRLSAEEREELQRVNLCLDDDACADQESAFARFGTLMSRLDGFDPITTKSDILEYQYRIYRTVWPEAVALRASGELLCLAGAIECPVLAIHGNYDAHPAAGVREPLAQVVKEFRFILLARCGHTPWRERWAREAFYRILRAELTKG